MKTCECGNAIKNKSSEKCLNCSNKEKATKHNLSKHKLYPVWSAIKQRCNNPKMKSINTMVRGIKICEEWENSVENFINWCLTNGYKDGLSIDRRDNNGNYEPSNCRFVEHNIQIQNQRISCRNSSGYIGVFFEKTRNKYVARLTSNGKTKYLGRYNTAEEAGKAYNEYIISNNLEHTLNEGV